MNAPEPTPAAGHNSVSTDALKSFVDRIERLREEIKALNSDVSEVYKEAKSFGFDTKIMKKLIAERSKSPLDLIEQESLLEVYRAAMGMSSRARTRTDEEDS